MQVNPKILANESLEQLEEGQRVLALQLALAALPEEGEVGMPVTSEAVRAITDATGAYNSNKEGEFLNDYVYEMPSMIGDFVVNDSMNRLAAVDLTGSVCLWDTEKHEEIFFHEPLNESVWHSILFINDRTLIVWTRNISRRTMRRTETFSGRIHMTVSALLNLIQKLIMFIWSILRIRSIYYQLRPEKNQRQLQSRILTITLKKQLHILKYHLMENRLHFLNTTIMMMRVSIHCMFFPSIQKK